MGESRPRPTKETDQMDAVFITATLPAQMTPEAAEAAIRAVLADVGIPTGTWEPEQDLIPDPGQDSLAFWPGIIEMGADGWARIERAGVARWMGHGIAIEACAD
jgi:hypothetical protein